MIHLAFALEVLDQFGGRAHLERNMGAITASFEADDNFVSFRFTKPAKNGANLVYILRSEGGEIEISFLSAPRFTATLISRKSGLLVNQIRSQIEKETGLDLFWSPILEPHRTTYIYRKRDRA